MLQLIYTTIDGFQHLSSPGFHLNARYLDIIMHVELEIMDGLIREIGRNNWNSGIFSEN
jgi:hypothetical protein